MSRREEEQHCCNDMNDMNEYKGWIVQWTGWKAAQGSNNLAGQWLGWKEVQPGKWRYLAACIPGEAREYQKGEDFNISPQKGQFQITVKTPLGKANAAWEEGHDRLFRLIDSLEP